MAGRPKQKFIESKDFPTFLAGMMAGLNLSTADLAEKLDMSPAAVYTLMNGTLSPSDKVLAKLKLRPGFILDVQSGEDADEEPPTKTAKGKK